MLISYLYCKNMTLRVQNYIYLNQDILRLIMLESNIEVNQLFFMTCRFCYNISKDNHYWKEKFLKHNLPILSYDFHQYYPSYSYQWYKEYQYTHYAIHKTKQLWLHHNNSIDYYQSAIIGYLRINDDLAWLPQQFYKQIMNALDDCLYEHHELHFLIYRNVGTVNYQCYDIDDNILIVLTANLKAVESQLLIISMLYHLPHIIVKIL